MKQQRKLILILAIVLSVAIAAGSTMAYLQDTDEDVNVMTLGNVYIKQNEQERNDEGVLVQFTQGKPMYPAIYDGDSYPADLPENWPVANDYAWEMTEQNENVIDKIVTVTNTGKSPAYVRTYIAFEGIGSYGPEGGCVRIVNNGSNVKDEIATELVGTIQVNGVDYTVYAYTYLNPLAPGETTIPSLKQVYLDKAAGNDEVAYYGDTYDILVVSQAMQTMGFEDQNENGTAADEALNTGFGETNKENLTKWFGDAYDKEGMPITMVDTVQELISALQAGDKRIVLTGDIILDKPVDYDFMSTAGNGSPLFAENKESGITLDLNGFNIIALEDALLDGKTNSNGTLLVRYSTLNIEGTGSIITNNQSMCVYGWEYSNININGGTYISNASERNESAIYVNNPNVMIHVYDGDFTQCDYAFNVHDKCGNTAVISLHEGIEFKQFLKNGKTDVIGADIAAGRIVAAEGCEITTQEVDGQVWYKVVKK